MMNRKQIAIGGRAHSRESRDDGRRQRRRFPGAEGQYRRADPEAHGHGAGNGRGEGEGRAGARGRGGAGAAAKPAAVGLGGQGRVAGGFPLPLRHHRPGRFAEIATGSGFAPAPRIIAKPGRQRRGGLWIVDHARTTIRSPPTRPSGNGDSRKDLYFDLAYFNWTAAEGLNVLGGKFKNNLYRPGKNALIWDNDLNPEGFGAHLCQRAVLRQCAVGLDRE